MREKNSYHYLKICDNAKNNQCKKMRENDKCEKMRENDKCGKSEKFVAFIAQ